MGLRERVLRRVADRPKVTPDYDVITRIEQDLDDQRRTEERQAAARAAAQVCAHEGHLEPTDDGEEFFLWGSPTPLRTLAGCPRCGAPAGDVTGEGIDAAYKLRAAGLA